MPELNPRQLQIIAYVRERERCLVADVARHLRLETYLTRDSINVLAKRGYLKKRVIRGVAEGTFNKGRTHVQKMVEVRLGERAVDAEENPG